MYEGRASDEETAPRRLARLIESHIPASRQWLIDMTPRRDPSLHDLSASQFLRPYSRVAPYAEGLKLSRILRGMTAAAQASSGYHLWWHPHNFGQYLTQNMDNLDVILRHFKRLEDTYGMRSLTMEEVGSELDNDE